MVSEVRGHATVAGTARYAARAQGIPRSHFRDFRELTFSSLGVGTYLGNPDAETDRSVEEALVHSVASGAVNVVDTAINYRHQKAERSVGRALRRLIQENRITRDEIFLCTKNGYLAPDGDAPVPPAEWIRQELVATRSLDPKEIVDGAHAMSVSFLRDQLARSLHNLGVEAVDLLYLHNAADAQLEAVGRRVFMERLAAAFEFYEEARKKGRLLWYGLATWDTFRLARTEPGYLSLQDVVEVARAAGGDAHGFAFIQFPFNLAMPEAAMIRNQPVRGQRVTLFEAAHLLHVGTFSSVPLMQGRLAQWSGAWPGWTGAQTALQFARSAPHHLAPLVGQKGLDHVEENLKVARSPPLDPEEFHSLLKK